MISRRALTAVLAAALTALAAAAPPEWTPARPGYRWSFPRDHHAHPEYRIEWWYFTGELESPAEPGRRWGYQLTFFRVGLTRDSLPGGSGWSASQLVMGHAAVGDFARRQHRFSELLYRASPLLGGFGEPPGPLLAWSRAPAGTDGRWTLERAGQGFRVVAGDSARRLAFDLTLTPGRRLVFQGPGGYSVKGRGRGAASLYYSFTRLDTRGTLRLDGRSWTVRGRSWMDREFSSSQLEPGQVGWDWFSLTLDDGRDLMLYVLRRADGSVDWRSATLVPARGAARPLVPGEWSVRATATWKSPASGAVYPARWTVEVPGEGLRLELRPRMADQENRSALAPAVVYWEGAVEALAAPPRPGGAARAVGRGYVELTGYARGSRPPL